LVVVVIVVKTVSENSEGSGGRASADNIEAVVYNIKQYLM
jgi:hypothetical protein